MHHRPTAESLTAKRFQEAASEIWDFRE